MSAIKHFKAIVDIGERIKEIDVSIYEHHYYPIVFGSWTLIVGKRKERTKFDWDGRDGYLQYSEASFPDSSYSNSNVEWTHIKNEGVNYDDPVSVYERIKKYLLTKYCV